MLRGDPYSPWETLAEMRRKVDLARAYVAPGSESDPDSRKPAPLGILHPYFGAEFRHDTGGVIAHFRRGVPEDEYTVLVVGGSVASAFVVNAGDRLAARLEEDPRLAGRKARVLNYAHPGFKQPQQLTRICWLLSLGFRPDAVINVDGFNEVALALANSDDGIHPAFPSFPQWGVLVQDHASLQPEDLDLLCESWEVRRGARAILDRTIAWKLYHSSLWSRAALGRLDVLNRRSAGLQERLLARREATTLPEPIRRQILGPTFAERKPDVLGSCVVTWSECSRALDALCDRAGARYLHVLQPTLGDVGSKPRTAGEEAIPFPSPAWERAAREGYPRLREAGAELARDGVAFLDASGVFADVREPVYFDACHFGPRGCEILCDAVADAFAERALGPLEALSDRQQRGNPRAEREEDGTGEPHEPAEAGERPHADPRQR